ncbi:MAG: alpha/beta hydrolase family protein [Candidatus Micrarchaeia archaeon]
MQQKIVFKSQGKKVSVILDVPLAAGKVPALVLCHGFLGRKEQKLLSVFAHEFCKAGFLVFRFDFFGCNANKPAKKIVGVHEHERQILDALALLRKMRGVDSKKIFIAGHSYGANICLLAAAHRKVAGVILLAPGRKFEKYAHLFNNNTFKIFGRSFAVTKRAWRGWTETDLDDALAKIKCPLLVIAAGLDEYVPIKELKKRFSGKAKIEVFRSSDHLMHGFEEKAAKKALKFITRIR